MPQFLPSRNVRSYTMNYLTEGPTGQYLRLTGANSSASSASAPLDTSSSFTVSAWVRLDTLDAFNTMVAQDGGQVSAFYLQKRSDERLSFTTFPLVVIAVAGLVTTLLGSVLGGIALYHYATGVAVSGFTTVILMLFIFSGLILISLGTMSLYLGRLFEEAKGRPLYLVRRASKTLTEASSAPEREEPAG